MGFIDGIGRLLAGKPVFVNSNTTSNTIKDSDNTPVVIVSHVESGLSGDGMNCSVHIHNQSGGKIFIDKIRLLNTTKELDHTLNPGEEKEFCDVFRGKRPNHENYKFCELQYRAENGKYFKSNHKLDYKPEQNGTYSLYNVHFVPPIHCI